MRIPRTTASTATKTLLAIALSALALLCVVQPAGAQTSDLILSEVVEGSSFNKAVELYNGTGASIDLAAGGYTLQFYFNGNLSAGTTLSLSGTIAAGDVYVIADDSADPAVLAVADSTPSNSFFNGDDAIVLRKGGATGMIVDSFGEVGFDPGSQWGSGTVSTADNTLRRQSTVCAGDSNETNSFDPTTEWDGFATDDFSGLGSHTASCGGTGGPGGGGLSDLLLSEYVEGSSNNKALEFYNGTGASIDLAADGYQVEIYFNGSTSAGQTIALTGTVADGATYVLANSNASGAVTSVADQTSGGVTFNGDDAVVLRKGAGGPIVDSLGQVGVDPGQEWGSGLISTKDNTLRRLDTVCAGDTTETDAFDPSVEWDGFSRNTFDDLGSHTANCGSGPGPGSSVEIFDIQGNGLASTYAGQSVTTEANVVTAVGVDGFFIQTPDNRADADPETSNGILVYTGTAPTVSVGDLVDVSGTVVEYFDFTEISPASSVTVTATGQTLPTAVTFDGSTPSPVAPLSATEFERYEGMRVSVTGGAVSGPNQSFTTDPVAEVHIVAGGTRAYREPGIEYPGLAGLPVWDGNPEVFELDPDKLGLANQTIPAGSSFTAEGVLAYEFGDYEIWATSLTTTPTSLPLAVGARNAGEFTVGSLNLFRLFDDVADGGETVVTTAEYNIRLSKFSQYILGVLDAPDILAVQEVEKLGVLQDLAAEIASDDPAAIYNGYLVEGNDVGGIDVGFLVRNTVSVTAVTQLGASELHTFDNTLLHDRPPLLLEASYTGNGAAFDISVLVVHNRSLGGIDDPTSGPRVRNKRLEQAQSIATMVQNEQSADPNVRLVVTGDFNAYQFTDGYVDAVGQIMGDFVPGDNLLSGPDLVSPNLTNQVLGLPAADRYSFIFGGTAQVLDHALTSSALNTFARGMAYGRGNADAARDLINDDTTPLRSSDHDGLVLYVMSDFDADGVPDDQDACPQNASCQ